MHRQGENLLGTSSSLQGSKDITIRKWLYHNKEDRSSISKIIPYGVDRIKQNIYFAYFRVKLSKIIYIKQDNAVLTLHTPQKQVSY